MNNPGPIIPQSPPKKKNRLARFEKRIGYINALLLKIGLWILIILSLGLLWREYYRSYFLIRPIEVPTALSESGYSPTVVSQRIFDELENLINSTSSVRDFQGFSADQNTAVVDFQVAGFGLSVQSLATQLRMAMGKTERIITGEIVDEGEQLALRLRVPGKRIDDLRVSYSSISSALDSLAKEAALNIFEFTEPYLYAVYLNSQNKTEQALAACNKLVNDKNERKWGFNLIANIEKNRENYKKSITYYKRAAIEDKDFALPIQNLANLYALMDSSELALNYYEKVINMNSNNRVWNLSNYYLALMNSPNPDPQKLKAVKEKVIEAGKEDSSIYDYCANQATNYGNYKDAIDWSDLTLEMEPSNMSGLIHRSLGNCAMGNKEACIKGKSQFETYYPDNSLMLVADLLISIMDKEYGTYNHLLDSIKGHPELMANADSMKLFDIMHDVYNDNLPRAKKRFTEYSRSSLPDVTKLKQFFFARDLFPILPDSLRNELEKALP